VAAPALVAGSAALAERPAAAGLAEARSAGCWPPAAERRWAAALPWAEAHSAAGGWHWAPAPPALLLEAPPGHSASRRGSRETRSADCRLPAAERRWAAALRWAKAHSASGGWRWAAAHPAWLLEAPPGHSASRWGSRETRSADCRLPAAERRWAAAARLAAEGSARRASRGRDSPRARPVAVRRQPPVERAALGPCRRREPESSGPAHSGASAGR
jgi:hypothetical protein